MIVENLGLVFGNTIRSKAYVQMMFCMGLFPARYMFLPGEESVRAGIPESIDVPIVNWEGGEVTRFCFRPYEPLLETFRRYQQDFSVLDSGDINAPSSSALIQGIPEEYLVYSGYSRVLINNTNILNSKRTIHVHGGYLPQFKGATGFYYGMLEHGFLGQSAILIDSGIDTGKIIARTRFRITRGIDVDYVYDPVTRAYLLTDVMRKLNQDGSLELMENENGFVHYVIHPVLKAIAIEKGFSAC